jgi:hypothetical protein
MLQSKETRNKCLREQIASLRGTPNLTVYRILSRFLRSVRLALQLARRLLPCVLIFAVHKKPVLLL